MITARKVTTSALKLLVRSCEVGRVEQTLSERKHTWMLVLHKFLSEIPVTCSAKSTRLVGPLPPAHVFTLYMAQIPSVATPHSGIKLLAYCAVISFCDSRRAFCLLSHKLSRVLAYLSSPLSTSIKIYLKRASKQLIIASAKSRALVFFLRLGWRGIYTSPLLKSKVSTNVYFNDLSERLLLRTLS